MLVIKYYFPVRRSFFILTSVCALFSVHFSFGLTIAGQEYLPLRRSGTNLGLTTTVFADGKNILMCGAAQNIRAELNQRDTLINGTRVWLNFPVAENRGIFYLSRLDYERTVVPLLRPRAFGLDRYRLRHIVLDPGHGGRDTGARNARLRSQEKKLTLDIADRVRQRLEILGYRVSITREEDRFVELRDRSRLANSLSADLFVSLHLNASVDKSVTGIETYAYTPRGAPSSARQEVAASDRVFQNANVHDIANLWLAYEVQRSMIINLKSRDRGVRHARFAVLEGLRCPGILIEGGYISSSVEGGRLCSTLYRQQLANAIVEGIRNYHRRLINAR